MLEWVMLQPSNGKLVPYTSVSATTLAEARLTVETQLNAARKEGDRKRLADWTEAGRPMRLYGGMRHEPKSTVTCYCGSKIAVAQITDQARLTEFHYAIKDLGWSFWKDRWWCPRCGPPLPDNPIYYQCESCGALPGHHCHNYDGQRGTPHTCRNHLAKCYREAQAAVHHEIEVAVPTAEKVMIEHVEQLSLF